MLKIYQTAKALESSDPVQSCNHYRNLSQEMTFPLKNLSLVKAHIVCADLSNVAVVPENLSESDPWLSELDSTRQITEAEKAGDPRLLAQAQFKKAQKISQVRDKMEWTEKAFASVQKIKNPTAEDEALKSELQNRIYKLSPRLIPNPKPSDYEKVASDYFFHRQFSKGRDYLKKIMESREFSLEEQYQARKAYRNSFKTEQRKDEHVDEAKEFAQWTVKNASPLRIHEAYVTWARAQWTQGDAGTAREILAKAEKVLKKKFPLDEINFIRARMAEEAQNHDQALEFLAKAEKDSKNNRALRGRILFSQAWILRKKSLYPEAAAALEKLKNETQDPFDKNRYMFWLAKSLKQAGKNDEATKEFQALTENDPLGYYGMVAYRELNSEIPALEVERKLASDEIRPTGVNPQDFDMIRALLTVEEFGILEKYLDLKTQELRSHSKQDLDTWLYFLKAYAKAGLYNPLFQQVGGLAVEIKAKLLSQNPELLFPRRYLDLIQANGEKFGVRPELMLSIIRQESAFNPQARSHADAFGLMQVIPSVAQIHEKETGIKVEHFDELYKPEINIPVGAALLASLGKKYRGQFILTAAAYNANERAIETWLKTRLKEDPLEFIEDIPYEETKGYVKLVLRNFIFYSRLANPGKTLAFPNWCLEDLHSFKVSTR